MEPVPDEETAARPPGDAADVPLETPADDVAEQAVTAAPLDDADEADETEIAVIHRGLEVDEADAADQARTAGHDDEYR